MSEKKVVACIRVYIALHSEQLNIFENSYRIGEFELEHVNRAKRW